VTVVQIAGDQLVVTMPALDRFWSLRRRIVVPVAHVRGATADPGVTGESAGVRAPGTHLPRVITAGICSRDGERTFWNLRASREPVVVELTGERFTRLVLGVADARPPRKRSSRRSAGGEHPDRGTVARGVRRAAGHQQPQPGRHFGGKRRALPHRHDHLRAGQPVDRGVGAGEVAGVPDDVDTCDQWRPVGDGDRDVLPGVKDHDRTERELSGRQGTGRLRRSVEHPLQTPTPGGRHHMRFNEGAGLDTSDVQDVRGSGGGRGRGLAVGGGGLGVVGLIVVVLFQVLGGGGSGSGNPLSGFGGIGTDQAADNSQLAAECRTGADANRSAECAVVAQIESIQDYWTGVLDGYQRTDTIFFSGSVQTGCGGASSGTGPFYCPADQLVYIDLTFFDDLQQRFGAEGGVFVDGYVLAHEYGHHVQNLLGTNQQVTPGESGPTSGTVRLELQADCYAGAWANHAETVPDESGQPLIADITDDDIARALDAAGRIGDDFIQSNLGGGSVDEGSFTHGSSEQRQRWFTTGYSTGDPAQCNTFGTDDLG
jgi:predicted metalloprotease